MGKLPEPIEESLDLIKKMDAIDRQRLLLSRMKDLGDDLKQFNGGDDAENARYALSAYMNFVCAAAMADGKITPEELLHIKPIMETVLGHKLSEKDAIAILKGLDKSGVLDVKTAFDYFMERDQKLAGKLMFVAVNVIALDGNVNRKEIKFLRELLE